MFPLHDTLDDALRTELIEYDDLTAAFLARRGIIKKEDAEIFLNPSYDEHLHDPLLMIDMRKAAERLATAIFSGEKIAVWSDYDCDGIPGAVVLHDFLKKVGANFENYIPHRHNEGYGMNADGVDSLAKSGVKLIITIDSGITDITPIAHAKKLGVEVIVTDHHLPTEAGVPDAFAVVNPNARENETYPFHELCGAGVAWKLVCATLVIAPELRKKIPAGWEKWLLDMVGLATIADMVPLVGENRVLATYGLKVLRKSPRIGLQKMLRGMRYDQRALTEDDVGFMIAPRVNAASRMGDARDAFLLFTTIDENEADELAKKLERINRQRKTDVGVITRAVHARLKERSEIRSVIALGDPDWKPSLLGLVAGGIADEHERPVFLWGREGNGKIKGSVRSAGGIHALELMRITEEAFIEYGGHANAGGFTVRDDSVFFLEDRLVEALARMGTDVTQKKMLEMHADAIIESVDVNVSFLTKIEKLAPFGIQNPKPVFLLKDAIVREISHFGKGKEHLKLKICSSEGNDTIDAVTFFVKKAIAHTVDSLTPNSRVSILAHLERDTFSRYNPVRLRLLDIRNI